MVCLALKALNVQFVEEVACDQTPALWHESRSARNGLLPKQNILPQIWRLGKTLGLITCPDVP